MHLATPILAATQVVLLVGLLWVLWLTRRAQDSMIASFMAEREIKDRIIREMGRRIAMQQEALIAAGLASDPPARNPET